MRGVDNKEQYAIPGVTASPSRSKAVAIKWNSAEVVNAMMDRMKAKLCSFEVTPEITSGVNRIKDLNAADMDMFVKGLIAACPEKNVNGAKELDYDRMIMESREKLSGFHAAHRDHFNCNINKFYPHSLSDDVKVAEVPLQLADNGKSLDYVENGYFLHYPDIDLMVVNCKTACASVIKEWLDNKDNLYVGPACAFPMLIEEDSSFFIPSDEKSMSRMLQNKKDAANIIKRIEEGKEDPAKYLALRGKTLGCVCAPYPCHTYVYVEVLRYLAKRADKNKE
jgi:hypothetical protein